MFQSFLKLLSDEGWINQNKILVIDANQLLYSTNNRFWIWHWHLNFQVSGSWETLCEEHVNIDISYFSNHTFFLLCLGSRCFTHNISVIQGWRVWSFARVELLCFCGGMGQIHQWTAHKWMDAFGNLNKWAFSWWNSSPGCWICRGLPHQRVNLQLLPR